MVKIDKPFHGAVLNHRHGEQTDRGLRVRVEGEAPSRQAVAVNGHPAVRDGNRFSCPVLLNGPQNRIVAGCSGALGRGEHAVQVLWDRNSRPRYRFSIDDNIFFLRDIAAKRYPSLFDSFYLAGLRELNQKYGARFSLNCYFTDGEDFSLPDFPSRYRREWADNADWLRLSFHAWADKPDRPYQEAKAEKLAHDFDRVYHEIARFAGEEAWAPPTVIHWAMAPPACLQVLKTRGVRVLSGFFRRMPDGSYDINYGLDPIRSALADRHDALMDFESGLLFSRIDIVCNNTPVEQVVPTLEPLTGDPQRAEVMDLFTHEQYFWDFYERYVPDHFARLEKAVGFCAERGYEPVWFHDGLMGAPAEGW